jgi:HEAT repeat protein
VDLQKAWKRQKIWLMEREDRETERRQQIQKIKQESQANLQRLLLKLDEPGNHPMAIPGIVNYGKDALGGLIRLLDSDDPDARYGAALALGNINDQSSIPALMKSLHDKHAAVRFFAVDALGKLKAKEAAQAIGELLEDESPNVRKHANDVLLSLNTIESLQILREKSRPKWWPFGE